MGSGTVWFGGEWSLVQAWESPFLVFNGICSRTLSQVSVGVPHHAALTGVTGPALPGDDSSTAQGSLSWDCNCLEQLMEPTQPQHHPGTGLYWEHWEGAAGGGCGHLGWGKGLIHEPGYTWGIHFPSGSDPEGDIQESLDLLG